MCLAASLASAGLWKGTEITLHLLVSQSCLKNTSIHPYLPITASRAFKICFGIKSTKEELSWVICFIFFTPPPHWASEGTTQVSSSYELTDGAFQVAQHEHQLLGLRAGQQLGWLLCHVGEEMEQETWRTYEQGWRHLVNTCHKEWRENSPGLHEVTETVELFGTATFSSCTLVKSLLFIFNSLAFPLWLRLYIYSLIKWISIYQTKHALHSASSS